EVEALERVAAVGDEAGGEVADRHPEDEAGVEAAGAADRPAPEAPVDRAAAADVARADDDVDAAARAADELGQEARVVAEVRVHLDDDVVVAGERPGEALEVGRAEPELAGAVEDVDARV